MPPTSFSADRTPPFHSAGYHGRPRLTAREVVTVRGHSSSVSTAIASLTVFSAGEPMARLSAGRAESNRSMPIVAETEQIADRRNSSLNSRAQISDGSARRHDRGLLPVPARDPRTRLDPTH